MRTQARLKPTAVAFLKDNRLEQYREKVANQLVAVLQKDPRIVAVSFNVKGRKNKVVAKITGTGERFIFNVDLAWEA